MTDIETPLPTQCQCHQDQGQTGCPLHQDQELTAPAVPAVTMLPVTSSNVQACGYDPGVRELHVRYRSGPAVFVYGLVGTEKWAALQTVESKGSYIATEVKAKHPLVRKVVPELAEVSKA